MKTKFKNIVCKAKKNFVTNMKDEEGALTTIEIVVLLMVIILIVGVIAMWLRNKVSSTLEKANAIDNI